MSIAFFKNPPSIVIGKGSCSFQQDARCGLVAASARSDEEDIVCPCCIHRTAQVSLERIDVDETGASSCKTIAYFTWNRYDSITIQTRTDRCCITSRQINAGKAGPYN
jgi:hypothetical protein